MSPAWTRPFPRHLGRARAIQLAVAGYPCLDELHEGTAAGINALRRLKIKRCGELALRLSSRLTFAYVCVAIRAIHSSRCISAELLVYFIQAGIFSEVVRANHLTVNMPLQIRVGVPRLSGDAEMRGPARGTMPTSICGWVSAVRFARSGRISFRLIAQR